MSKVLAAMPRSSIHYSHVLHNPLFLYTKGVSLAWHYPRNPLWGVSPEGKGSFVLQLQDSRERRP